jgi:hypothetical protein
MPGFTMINSSSSCDKNPLSQCLFDVKPDISIYRNGLRTASLKTDSSLAEFFIEFKWSTGDNPFCDGMPFLSDSKTASDTLGQITAYAAVQLAAQFRTHVFSVFIFRDTARLLRWDRSGTIVSEAFQYNVSDQLAEFFRRYSHASDVVRGVDETVTKPTPAQERQARDVLDIDRSIPLFKVLVPHEGGQYEFIVRAPDARPYTPPGRATRGFKAYDIAQRRVVFLKDSWRVNLPDILPEGKVYKILNNAKVKHVPKCLASGDISTSDYHATKTQNYQDLGHGSVTQLTGHRHYRLILDVIGSTLVDYQSSYDMVAAVRNGIIGEVPELHLTF